MYNVLLTEHSKAFVRCPPDRVQRGISYNVLPTVLSEVYPTMSSRQSAARHILQCFPNQAQRGVSYNVLPTERSEAYSTMSSRRSTASIERGVFYNAYNILPTCAWSAGHCRICLTALSLEDIVEYPSLRSVGRTLFNTPWCARSGGHCTIHLAALGREGIVGYASLHSVGRTL